MDDKVLFIVAAATALVGLVLLWIAAPPPEEGYRLVGTVTAVHGSTALVTTTIPVLTRGVRVGAPVNLTVIWADNHFIAPKQTTPKRT